VHCELEAIEDEVSGRERLEPHRVLEQIHKCACSIQLVTRVIGYLRQSLDRTGEGVAVERQQTEIQAMADSKGLEVVRWIIDNDTSATRGHREGFEALIDAVKTDPSLELAAWHSDRLCRLVVDSERLIALDRPIHTVVGGEVDLTSPSGRLVYRLMASVAQHEGEIKSARQKASSRQRVRAGRGWGPRRPFGYEHRNGEAKEDEAPIVVEMYRRVLNGEGLTSIARDLNKRGVTTSMGHAWSQASLRNLLLNPRYKGTVTYLRQEKGEAVWPAIVSEDLWRAVHSRLTAEQRAPGSNARKHSLSGLVRCGECGGKCRVVSRSTGVHGYGCRENQCVSKNGPKLDEFVIRAVAEILAEGVALSENLVQSEEDKALISEATATLLNVKEDENRLMGLYNSDLLSGEMLDQALRKNKVKKDQAEEVLAELGQLGTPSDGFEDLGVEEIEAELWAMPLSKRRETIADTAPWIYLLKTGKGKPFSPEAVWILPEEAKTFPIQKPVT
jgi:DNA invertase Pin-like site-specific DNA recombinase